MDELHHITTGVMGLAVCDIFYHICPSKVEVYNSKGELKHCCKFASQFFYVCTPINMWILVTRIENVRTHLGRAKLLMDNYLITIFFNNVGGS